MGQPSFHLNQSSHQSSSQSLLVVAMKLKRKQQLLLAKVVERHINQILAQISFRVKISAKKTDVFELFFFIFANLAKARNFVPR